MAEEKASLADVAEGLQRLEATMRHTCPTREEIDALRQNIDKRTADAALDRAAVEELAERVTSLEAKVRNLAEREPSDEGEHSEKLDRLQQEVKDLKQQLVLDGTPIAEVLQELRNNRVAHEERLTKVEERSVSAQGGWFAIPSKLRVGIVIALLIFLLAVAIALIIGTIRGSRNDSHSSASIAPTAIVTPKERDELTAQLKAQKAEIDALKKRIDTAAPSQAGPAVALHEEVLAIKRQLGLLQTQVKKLLQQHPAKEYLYVPED